MESPALNPLVLDSISQGGVCQSLSLPLPGGPTSVASRMQKVRAAAQGRAGLRGAWACWKGNAGHRQLLQRLMRGLQYRRKRGQYSFIAGCFLPHVVSVWKTSTEIWHRLGHVLEVKAKSYRHHSTAFHNIVPFSLTVNLLCSLESRQEMLPQMYSSVVLALPDIFVAFWGMCTPVRGDFFLWMHKERLSWCKESCFTLHCSKWIIWYLKKGDFHWTLLTSAQESTGYFGIQALKTPNNVAAAAKLAVVPSNRDSNNKQTLQKNVDCAWNCT